MKNIRIIVNSYIYNRLYTILVRTCIRTCLCSQPASSAIILPPSCKFNAALLPPELAPISPSLRGWKAVLT